MNCFIKKAVAWLKSLFVGQNPEATKPATVKRKRERQPTLWPSIRGKVTIWERCFNDARINKEFKKTTDFAGDGDDILVELKGAIPPFGVYSCSDNAEVRRSYIEKETAQIDTRAIVPRTLAYTSIGSIDAPDDVNDVMVFEHGITILVAVPTLSMPDGWFAMNEGVLYEILYTNWTHKHGHDLVKLYVVVDEDGRVHPLWRYSVQHQTLKRKRGRGMVDIPCPHWTRMGGNDWGHIVSVFAAYMNLSLEREMYWNCTVKSESVPPIAFPVLSYDIARIFPKRQRDGNGKVVHWTRPHKRKTKNGYTNVRAHIRGNTWWNVDGRRVRITMPGKHHGHVTATPGATGVKSDLGDEYIDRDTGLRYVGVGESRFLRLLNRAKVVKDEIEIKEIA